MKTDPRPDVYRSGLLEDTLPFWIRHAVDREQGGFLFCLDRDGTVVDTDKPMWIHGRFTWLLSTMCAVVERRDEWLGLARHGLDFLLKHGFDADGRMFFLVTRDGRPLRKRRYLFTECFAVMALAAYARATGDREKLQKARDLFDRVVMLLETPGSLEPKVSPETRPARNLGIPMILTCVAQELREADPDPRWTALIDRCVGDVESHFMDPKRQCVLEQVGPDGAFIDTFDGRLLNPGHSIEMGGFILREARHRGNDARLIKLGATIVDWSWERGWDTKHGGLYCYRDADGRPVQEYWHDMKFWWPHNEAVTATLRAWLLTGDPRHAGRHREVRDWSYAHFPDREHGEWFGYLHRDGSVASPLKGNHWKGPFHLPRMQLDCWKLLEEEREAGAK